MQPGSRLTSLAAKGKFLLPITSLWLILLVWQRWASRGVLPSDDALLIWEFYRQRISPSQSLIDVLSQITGEFNNIWLFLPLKALDVLGLLTYSNALTVAAACSLGVGLLVTAFLAWTGLNPWIANLAGASIMLSLAQIEYLTFYVPIQHSVTIIYALLLTWIMSSLARSTPVQPYRSPRWWAWLVLLGTSWTVRTPIVLVLLLLFAGGLVLTRARRNARILLIGPITVFAVIALLATLGSPGAQLRFLITNLCPPTVCSEIEFDSVALATTSLALVLIWAIVGFFPFKTDDSSASHRTAPNLLFEVRGLGGLTAVVSLVLVLVATPVAVAGLLFISPASKGLLQSVPTRWLVSEVSLLAVIVAAVIWVLTLWVSKSAGAVAFGSIALLATSGYIASRGHLSGLADTLPDAVDLDGLFLNRYALYSVVPFACALALAGNRAWLWFRDSNALRSHPATPGAMLSVFVLVLGVPWIVSVPSLVQSATRTLSDLQMSTVVLSDDGVPAAKICSQGFSAAWINDEATLPDFPQISLESVRNYAPLSPQSLEIIATAADKNWFNGPCFLNELSSTKLRNESIEIELVSGVGSPTSGMSAVGKGTGRSLTIFPDLYRVQGGAQVVLLSNSPTRSDKESECATGSIVFDWEGAHVSLEDLEGFDVASRNFPIIGTKDVQFRLDADGREITFSSSDSGTSWILPERVCFDVDQMAIESVGRQSVTLFSEREQ